MHLKCFLCELHMVASIVLHAKMVQLFLPYDHPLHFHFTWDCTAAPRIVIDYLEVKQIVLECENASLKG